MPSHTYSPKTFLRHARNALLARYFHERDLLLDLDIATMPEHAADDQFEAWTALSDEQRLGVESDFREVDALAHEQGIRTLLDEGHFHGVDFEPAFAGLDGFHDKALLALLDAPDAFAVAARFNYADTRPKRYWRRHVGLPRVVPADDAAACARLSGVLGAYLRETEGRGYVCVTEVYRRGDRYYFFALPEDYAITHLEYAEGALQRRKSRPAFDIVFVYSMPNGTLDVYFEGSKRKVIDLQQLFCRAILRQEVSLLPGGDQVFRLNEFKRRGFHFVFEPESGITDMRIRRLRFAAMGSRRRWILEVGADDPPHAIWDMMDDTFHCSPTPESSATTKISLALLNITQARVRVAFGPGRGRRTRTFDVTWPNLCPLDHDGRDGAIRQVLIDSGIEPRFDAQMSA
jgi:hypothetical protein